MKRYLGFSGGKDSTATWLLAREQGVVLTPVFADTGHEHPLTYQYLDYLEGVLGPIVRIRADFSERMAYKRRHLADRWRAHGIEEERIAETLAHLVPTGIPMLDLCLLKGRFPSTRARFCTEELKVLPFQQQILLPDLRAGLEVEQWVGVRRDESYQRSKIAHEREWIDPGYWIYRPLLEWTADQVFALHRQHGIEPNPLYKQGMGRVGCMPCIHANKGELRQIAQRFPEEFERLANWEAAVTKVAKRGAATFFAQDKTPGQAADQTRSNALAVRDWALTKHGGRELDLQLVNEELAMCHSLYGLCE